RRFAARSAYVKVRDRASFEFAIASAAVALAIEDGVVREARVAVGGVATKPWRLPEVERRLVGQPADEAHARQAAEAATDGAVTHGANAYKVPLLRAVVARAILTVAGAA
ncbi:MAG TPA: xanthine dehydrogenase family protein subunit M, partial [Acetobacteraceae bacterium]|nr:xanthine dehydrogenase family protein subunit M [Acetobacteraceae bacterium]